MNQYDIIRRPIVTEKSSLCKEAGNQYVFEVARGANKIEIAKAVEQLFKVKVLSVRVMNMEGKEAAAWQVLGQDAGLAKGDRETESQRQNLISLKVRNGRKRI